MQIHQVGHPRIVGARQVDGRNVAIGHAEPEGCSPRVFCFRVKLGKDPGDRFLECRHVARHRVPHDVEIDIDLAMAHPIPHAGDHAPRHFRMRGPNLIAYASCRFTDNLYPVKHRALRQFAGVEARPVVPA